MIVVISVSQSIQDEIRYVMKCRHCDGKLVLKVTDNKEYWNYVVVSRPCKCPMCFRHISNLSPEASLLRCHEHEVKEVLARVRRYNRLFVGGLTGFVQKVHELPLLMKRMVWHMMDFDVNNVHFHEVRIFALSVPMSKFSVHMKSGRSYGMVQGNGKISKIKNLTIGHFKTLSLRVRF